jgi:hypothetical protein
MYKKYRVATSLVLIMSSFVFAQDVTDKINLRLNIIDKVSFSVYCGLSHVFESAADRVKCDADNWKVSTRPVVVVPVQRPADIPAAPVVNTTEGMPVITASSSAPVVAVTETNPVLAEIRRKLDENTAAISKLEDKTAELERMGVGQTIVKYVSSGSRGPKGADGVTTVLYATPTATMFNSLSGSILIGQNNASFANNNISIGRDIVNTIDNSLQIGPSDVAKVTMVAGTSTSNMSVTVPGNVTANSLCIEDVCIDKSILKKIVDFFK